MKQNKQETTDRKNDHLELCINEDVGFNRKTTGFEKYDFVHYALTEVDYNAIDLSADFFGQKISFPFFISCMTGGTSEAEKINEKLAIVARQINIPIGVGSQRQALENKRYHKSYEVIKSNAGSVPVLSNIGAAQVARMRKVDKLQKIIDLVNATVLVIHVNPLQELLQKNGEPSFGGLMKNIEKVVKKIKVPVIVKEVGSGISKKAAKELLNLGVKGIDVAGAGGTSWAEVELKRNKEMDEYFRNWGIPTAFCVKDVSKLKKKYDFTLISSGGIKNGIEIAKSIALGADFAASARVILQSVIHDGIDRTMILLDKWFIDVKKIMYLTGAQNIRQLSKIKLIKSGD